MQVEPQRIHFLPRDRRADGVDVSRTDQVADNVRRVAGSVTSRRAHRDAAPAEEPTLIRALQVTERVGIAVERCANQLAVGFDHRPGSSPSSTSPSPASRRRICAPHGKRRHAEHRGRSEHAKQADGSPRHCRSAASLLSVVRFRGTARQCHRGRAAQPKCPSRTARTPEAARNDQQTEGQSTVEQNDSRLSLRLSERASCNLQLWAILQRLQAERLIVAAAGVPL